MVKAGSLGKRNPFIQQKPNNIGKNFSGRLGRMEKNTPILVIFDDGSGIISKKDGEFLKQDDKFLHLKTGDTTHSIPINRIVRVESKGVKK